MHKKEKKQQEKSHAIQISQPRGFFCGVEKREKEITNPFEFLSTKS